MSVYGIDHVQLSMPAGGEELVRRFYGDILGLTELPKPPELAARGGAWFRCGAAATSPRCGVGVSSGEKSASGAPRHRSGGNDRALAAAGFEVKYDSVEIEGFDRAFTADPFGNRIELLQARQERP